MQITPPTQTARWRQLPEQGTGCEREGMRRAGSALIPLHVWHTLHTARQHWLAQCAALCPALNTSQEHPVRVFSLRTHFAFASFVACFVTFCA